MKKKKIEKVIKKLKIEEDIWNVPNTLTMIRVLVTFLTVYLIFAGHDVVYVAAFFVFGMFTDFLDGFVARRYNRVTEFGRKFDMIADRFLFASVGVASIMNLAFVGLLDRYHLIQFFMIASREIIALPIAFVGFFSGKKIPEVRNIGKLTTCLQAFAFPSILLSVYYTQFSYSFYLAFLTSVVGIFSGLAYINDILKSEKKK